MIKVYSRYLFHHETDADGVCHFSNYLKICEEALHQLIRHEFMDLKFAVTSAQSEYLHPLHFGDLFSVSIEILNIRRSNFEALFSIEEEGILNAKISLRFIAIEPTQWTPIPLSEQFKKRLYGHNTCNV